MNQSSSFHISSKKTTKDPEILSFSLAVNNSISRCLSLLYSLKDMVYELKIKNNNKKLANDLLETQFRKFQEESDKLNNLMKEYYGK